MRLGDGQQVDQLKAELADALAERDAAQAELARDAAWDRSPAAISTARPCPAR
jgi:hypothetical protein